MDTSASANYLSMVHGERSLNTLASLTIIQLPLAPCPLQSVAGIGLHAAVLAASCRLSYLTSELRMATPKQGFNTQGYGPLNLQKLCFRPASSMAHYG